MGEGAVFKLRRLPGRCRCVAGELAQLLLPYQQCFAVAAVDFHRREQRRAALVGQPEMQAPGKPAEVFILAITQGQHRVVQAFERQVLTQYAALKTPRTVRRFAIAEGADHEQRVLRLAQVVLTDAAQRLHLHRQTGGLQLPGGLPGQLFGETALAGKADQPGRRVAVVGAEAFAGVAHLAFFAATVQVQQPAGNKEQRHHQRAEGEDDPPGPTEIAAGVQRINAGEQLGLERLAGVRVVGFDLAGGRVQVDLVQRAVVGR
ncbi:hypothetical protein [Pseudomonas sp. 22 E 5]|nr:hypothetical protein [Pseudomonas sp. 22 E 5]